MELDCHTQFIQPMKKMTVNSNTFYVSSLLFRDRNKAFPHFSQFLNYHSERKIRSASIFAIQKQLRNWAGKRFRTLTFPGA